MIDLFDELTGIADCLDRASIRYALIGGLAYSIWVETRATEDIDLLIEPQAWPTIADILSERGFQRIAKDMDFARARMRRLTKIESPDVVMLDLILADPPLDRGLDTAITIEQRGGRLVVAAPEIIIELKKLRLSPRDRLDIRELELLIGDRDENHPC